MATLTPNSNPTVASVLPPANNRLSGLLAGEAITRGNAVYIKSDGAVWKSNGTSANAAAKCRGLAGESAAIGEPVTIMRGLVIDYGTGLTPGADYYVSATAGSLDTTATTGGTAPVAWAVSATKIFIQGSSY